MNELLNNVMTSLPTVVLLLIFASMLYFLGKGADILIDQAVSLSLRWGVSKVIIGATIISLGTTLPEASVSVIAALGGQSDLALGNGIGSVIANTSLILGLAVILGVVPINRRLMLRQGLIMIAASVAVIIVSIPIMSRAQGGNISRITGIVFVVALVIYMVYSIKSSKKDPSNLLVDEAKELNEESNDRAPIGLTLIKMIVSVAMIIVSSRILISSVEITAVRIGIPQGVIAATLVAFGTSLPELMLAVKSVRKGHGELALGNVVGANVLNVLFVIGISASVTSGGLHVPDVYYQIQYPALLIIMAVFAFATLRKKPNIPKASGYLLLGIYLCYMILSYIL